MSRRHLTQKQHQFLEYLQDTVSETKVWPTYREIVDYFGYRSPNSVTQNLQALAKKGFLRRDRDGYQLVDRDGRDGSIGVKWTVQSGALMPQPGSDRVTLQTLLQGEDVHALRLDPQTPRDAELGDARFVFVSDEENPMAGDTLVVLDAGHIRLARAGDDLSSAQVLGHYAGHAGPYGLVMPFSESAHPGAVLAAQSAAQNGGMNHVHAEA